MVGWDIMDFGLRHDWSLLLALDPIPILALHWITDHKLGMVDCIGLAVQNGCWFPEGVCYWFCGAMILDFSHCI